MADKWRQIPLADVAIINSGKKPTRVVKMPNSDCQVPVIGGGGPFGFTDLALFNGGILITGRVGTLGKLIAPSGPCWPSDNALVIQPSGPATDRRFLRYTLEHVIAQAADMNRGAANPLITQSDLGRLTVSHPPITQQRAIAHILGTLDDKIELNRQMNETLEAIASAIFTSWFVDFEPVRAQANGEPPEAICRRLGLTPDLLTLFPDRLVDSEHSEIPDGWEVRKIEKVLKRLSSKVRYTKKHVKTYGRIPVFEQGANILLGYHDGIPQFDANINHPVLIFGDHTCITHLACEPFDISQNVIPLKGNDRPTMWVFYAIRGKQVFQEYRRHWMELIDKDVVVAPHSVCQMFTDHMTPIHLRIEANVRESSELAQIREALLPQLLSGDLRVPLECLS